MRCNSLMMPLVCIVIATCSVQALAQNIAIVNGNPIPSSMEDMMVSQLTAQPGSQPDSPQLRAEVKEELITREVLTQQAEKEGFAKNADVKEQLAIARQSILIRSFLNDFVKKHPASDAEIQVEFDKFKATAGGLEYHARHILVENEADAQSIIDKLKAGGKFEDLAKQSKDTGSANTGGDLGWATPSSFVKPFADALVALKPGQLTDTPVKTQYGYHVIRLEEVRPAKIPTLAEVKPQIVDALEQKKVQALEQALRSRAKIQ